MRQCYDTCERSSVFSASFLRICRTISCDCNFPPRVKHGGQLAWMYLYGVRRRETTPSLAALWLGEKKQRFSGTNQKPGLPRPFGTGPLKPCPQGLFFAFLTFLRPHFSLARLDNFRPPLTALGLQGWVYGDFASFIVIKLFEIVNYASQTH